MSKTKKQTGVLICPRCGSTKIIPHTNHKPTRHGEVFEAYYSMRLCENCKYTGYFFPEVPVNKLALIRAEIKKLRGK